MSIPHFRLFALPTHFCLCAATTRFDSNRGFSTFFKLRISLIYQGEYIEVRWQLCGTPFPLSWDLNSDRQVWWQVSLPTELSLQPLLVTS